MPLPTHPHKRGLAERAALISLVGLSVLSVIGVGVVTIYLNRLSSSAESMTRDVDMPDYLGRPAAVSATGGGSVMNLVIMVNQGGTLDSVVVANLSASRRNLTLITVPSQLRVADSNQTLASTYAIDPTITVLAMEGLTGARMDHAAHLDLACLGSVIDRTGGIQLSGVMMNGPDAIRLSQGSSEESSGAVGTARLIRSALIGLERHFTSIDPSRFADMVDLTSPCLKVDTGLTSQVVQDTFFESSIHPDETHIWPLETSPVSQGLDAEPDSLDQLRSALASPELSTTAQYQQASFLPQESVR
jgi:hypothetical protein